MKTADELRRAREDWRRLCRREAPDDLVRLGDLAFDRACDRVRRMRTRRRVQH